MQFIGQRSAQSEPRTAKSAIIRVVLLTNDLDFPRILAHAQDAKPSVILMRGEPLVPEARGRALLSAIEVCQAEIDTGAIVTLDSENRSRARVLPLR